eukprot:TRINITY_DN4237_c0_g1_i6.p1 TRINITY_DN4237_c0_g1~~TRINITY_DN4237_c0_g1_i6.p1  ORF type:complete len:116 (+),score=39.21 TRINITY_DN4237_c0_g1_i6:147-494(+)
MPNWVVERRGSDEGVDEITDAEFNNLRRVFILADSDGSGFIDREEFCYMLRILGIKLEEEHAAMLFDDADADHSGHIDFDEFLELMARNRRLLHCFKQRDPLSTIQKALRTKHVL